MAYSASYLRQRSWSDIPLELAGLVLRRLPAKVDRVRFAAVCPQWRSAAQQVPLPPPLPLVALPDGTTYSLPSSEKLQFPGCAGYTGACGDWLVFSSEEGCFLRNPFSNATVTLPALSRARIRYVADPFGRAWRESQEATTDLSKVMYCSPHLVAAFVRIQGSYRIAVCQPGADSWWSVHLDVWLPQFVDMALHQGKLYALANENGDLFSVDISIDQSTGDPRVSRVQRAIKGVSLPGFTGAGGYVMLKMLYLVQLHGRLLMVHRGIFGWLPIRTPGTFVTTGQNNFDVYEADFSRSEWTGVPTIGDDHVLFLRRRCFSSVCVSHYEMPGDRIFFFDNDDEDRWWYDEESPSCCKVYNMKDGKVSNPLPTVSWKRGLVFATWLFPQN